MKHIKFSQHNDLSVHDWGICTSAGIGGHTPISTPNFQLVFTCSGFKTTKPSNMNPNQALFSDSYKIMMADYKKRTGYQRCEYYQWCVLGDLLHHRCYFSWADYIMDVMSESKGMFFFVPSLPTRP
jgi:hypothetical protein